MVSKWWWGGKQLVNGALTESEMLQQSRNGEDAS